MIKKFKRTIKTGFVLFMMIIISILPVYSAEYSDKSSMNISESPLSNAYKLLLNDKKLTIGYIGGSITLGTSATKIIENGKIVSHTGGNIMDSWVNRVSSWFAEEYPEAEIETVNAGISETQTSLALYRLERTLMNTDGHDMPDVVFVEFTNNDSNIYTKQQHIIHIESLFRNILAINPYAEIIAVATNKYVGNLSTAAYIQVCDYYDIPIIDVGAVLAELIKAKNNGSVEEASGNLFYTVDNLHPSAAGYGEYFDTIKTKISSYLNITPQNNQLYDYNKSLPEKISDCLINKPYVMDISKVNFSGNVNVIDETVTFGYFGIGTESIIPLTFSDKSLSIGKNGVVSAEFEGNTFGILTYLDEGTYNYRYRIDNGEWKEKSLVISAWGYTYGRDYILEHKLSDSKHTVELEVLSDKAVVIGALFVNNSVEVIPTKTMLKFNVPKGNNAYKLIPFNTENLIEDREYTVKFKYKFADGTKMVTSADGDLFFAITKLTGNGSITTITHRTDWPENNIKYIDIDGLYVTLGITFSSDDIGEPRWIGFYSTCGKELCIADFKVYDSTDGKQTNLLNVNEYSTDINVWSDGWGMKLKDSDYVTYDANCFQMPKTVFNYVYSSADRTGLKLPKSVLKPETEYTISFKYSLAQGAIGYFALYDNDWNYLFLQDGYAKNPPYKSQIINNETAVFTFELSQEQYDAASYFHIGYLVPSQGTELYISDFTLYESADRNKTNRLPKTDYSTTIKGWSSKWSGNGSSKYVIYGTGDANNDGIVDVRDIVNTKKKISVTGFNPLADVNFDSSLNATDLIELRNNLLNK